MCLWFTENNHEAARDAHRGRQMSLRLGGVQVRCWNWRVCYRGFLVEENDAITAFNPVRLPGHEAQSCFEQWVSHCNPQSAQTPSLIDVAYVCCFGATGGDSRSMVTAGKEIRLMP